MKQKVLSVTAVLVSLCLMLSGCAGLNFSGYFQQLGDLLGGGTLTPFAQMEYIRPDMEQFDRTLEECCAAAETETDLNNMVGIIYDFYAAFDGFYTNLALSMIHYSKNQKDTYWEKEYHFCTENSARVDAALDRFYRVLAKSTLREELEGEDYFGPDYFSSYEGDSIYDEYFTDLLEQETALENQYYALIAQAGDDFAYTQTFYDTYGTQMAQIYVDLIRVRQAQAIYAGYASYSEFAYDFFYARDYTVSQATGYLADIRAELVPLYRQALQGTDVKLYTCTETEMFDYVQSMAQTVGGSVYEAFRAMEQARLYDITAGEDKLDASFELFIRDYMSPYVFVNPTGTEYDKLTFAHEFGHFCNDYVSMGSGVSIDVAEFFSQGMEYLSLCHGPAEENLNKLKMLSSLCIYVEQAAYASFEQQVYNLKEELTQQKIQELYSTVCENYGMEGGWSYLLVTHFFTEPMYVISYVVSNDAALQLYQMEKQSAGTGLQRMKDHLGTQQPYFLAFLAEAGLESPFAAGRIQRVKETLQSALAQ